MRVDRLSHVGAYPAERHVRRTFTDALPGIAFSRSFQTSYQGGERNFTGSLDDVRLYDSALTAEEILAPRCTVSSAHRPEVGGRGPPETAKSESRSSGFRGPVRASIIAVQNEPVLPRRPESCLRVSPDCIELSGGA